MTRTEIKAVELNNKLAALAREYVNMMIDADMMTADMRDHRDKLERQFSDYMTRDINLYATTGKYPQYA